MAKKMRLADENITVDEPCIRKLRAFRRSVLDEMRLALLESAKRPDGRVN